MQPFGARMLGVVSQDRREVALRVVHVAQVQIRARAQHVARLAARAGEQRSAHLLGSRSRAVQSAHLLLKQAAIQGVMSGIHLLDDVLSLLLADK